MPDTRRGVTLALFGALVLTPDALLLRLSGMDGMQMLGWRGLCMGSLFVLAWALTSRHRAADLAALASGGTLLVIANHAMNATLFPVGIAAAPVSVVLLAVATVPVWAALLSHVLLGERASRVTWATIAAVLAGIALAVTDTGEAALDARAVLGAACGLGVAAALALNFVCLRRSPQLPLLLAIGLGSLLAGSLGWGVTGPARMTDGAVPMVLATGLLILPLAFFSLSAASRMAPAATVSLLMLLETVLGPLWVWLGTGEAPTTRMLAGGAIVIGALALYLARPAAR
ncbi:DMT family transporter [Thetidibacter halocola]|uniref:DMT family transporter n=1 Tax=Thetidibacter halocola TaxID=2827239 RepID=A0A8J7WC99_9RHOB|nr:DMT family transporter [Thetidibacter halocola]MBS0123051.1 DMT family transporter [Thetidibacter halocola]